MNEPNESDPRRISRPRRLAAREFVLKEPEHSDLEITGDPAPTDYATLAKLPPEEAKRRISAGEFDVERNDLSGTAERNVPSKPAMIETGFLKQLATEIMAQGVAEETAWNYAVLIGDTPCYDEQGNLLVMDGDTVLATLKPLKP